MITKNISRFGRDTVEVLEWLNKLRELGVRVIFEQEGLDTADEVKILNGDINVMPSKELLNYITGNAMAMKMMKTVC
ncbi:recombinase family protein [Ureibacillus sp. FSL W8-0352]|uniref:recombinase family protein n=1 Tax=Ureibacillus sp. FSL W8-0352 TaxID=2954596 RepID=UPI0030F5C657